MRLRSTRDSDHRMVLRMRPYLVSIQMKRCIQLVTFAIASMMGIQPTLAGVLCLAQPGMSQMDSHSCCAASQNESLPQAPNSLPQNGQSARIASESQMRSNCEGGCCSVSPQNVPAPNPPLRAVTERAPIFPCVVTFAPTSSPAVRALIGGPSIASPPARHLLLKVFRI